MQQPDAASDTAAAAHEEPEAAPQESAAPEEPAATGAPVSDETPAPTDAPGAPEEPQGKTSRRGLVIALVAAAVVIVVAAAAFLLRPQGTATVSGIDGATQTSIATRIRPQGEGEVFLTSYRVRLYALSAANDKLAEELAREAKESKPVREVRVTGDGGFTFADMDDVPDGGYLVVIVDNDTEIEQELIVEYAEDNDYAVDEIVVTPPAEGDDAAKDEPAEKVDPRAAPYALYLAKCQELINTYGEGTAIDIWGGSGRAATGLVLAQTIDFNGDGLEELLVVYTTSNLADSFQVTEDTYRVEVWAYDPEGGEDGEGSIALVHEQRTSYTNGGMTFLTQYVRDNKVYLFFDGYDTIDYAAEGLPESTVRYIEGLWGMQEDQTFTKVLETWNQYDYEVPGGAFDRYFLNGGEAAADAYEAEAAQYMNASTYNFLEFSQYSDGGVNSLGSSGQSEARYSVDQTLQITRDTLALLEAGAGAADDDAPAASDA